MQFSQKRITMRSEFVRFNNFRLQRIKFFNIQHENIKKKDLIFEAKILKKNLILKLIVKLNRDKIVITFIKHTLRNIYFIRLR